MSVPVLCTEWSPDSGRCNPYRLRSPSDERSYSGGGSRWLYDHRFRFGEVAIVHQGRGTTLGFEPFADLP